MKGRKPRSLSHIEHADALRCVKLVAGEGQHVDDGFSQVDRDLPYRLHGVGVEQDAPLPGHLGSLFDGKDDSGLVVGPHEADDGGIGGAGSSRRLHIQQPSPFTGNSVTRYPRWRDARTSPLTAGCSTRLVTTCRLPSWVARAERIAALSLSVPQLVKMISSGIGPDQRRHLLAGLPDCSSPPGRRRMCMLEGFP